MKRRATARGSGGKARRRSTKGRDNSHRPPSSADLQRQPDEQARELAEARRQLAEALEGQTATSEVLKVISTSPGELAPVFNAILENATRICEAQFAEIALVENNAMRVAAGYGDAPRLPPSEMVPLDRSTVMGRSICDQKPVHVADLQNADNEFARGREFAKKYGHRTILCVPLIREGRALGTICVRRMEVRPFEQKHVDLLKTFAAQAAIAIENVRLFAEIEDKGRQLETANKYKSHFLASASHDLRQPLHALNLFIGQLRDESNPAERSRLVSRIDEAVGSMNELFEALLDMTKLEAGILKPNPTAIPVAHLLHRIEIIFADAARKKGLRLRVVASEAWVSSDPILLERIMLNLVSNAVHYTERGGVVVGCRHRGQELRIDICDTGAGIPANERQRIFGEFYQLSRRAPDRSDGFGLGLAIVDRLGRLLGHRVELESSPGRGSRFSVSVPLAAKPHGAEMPGPLWAIADPASGKRVIVIDDDTLVLDGMRGILQSWGCRVQTAVSGDAALAGLVKDGGSPDLIISDSRLADGESGVETIERLRAAVGAPIPAFVITGDTAPESLREARAGGFLLLHKPVSPMALRTTLNRLLKAHDTRVASSNSSVA